MLDLIVYQGETKLQQVELNDKPVTIGRDSRCDLVLNDISVSRQHATVEPSGNLYILRDNSSTNGTFVNDRAIRFQIINPGDALRIGSFILKVETIDKRRRETTKIRIEEPGDDPGGAEAAAEAPAAFQPGPSVQQAAVREIKEHFLRLYDIQQELGYIDNMPSLLDGSIHRMMIELEADRGCILLADFQSGREPVIPEQLIPSSVAYRETGSESADEEEIVVPHQFILTILQNRTGILSAEGNDGKEVSALGAPFLSRGKLLGMVYLEREDPRRPFTEEDLQFLTLIASLLAVNLTNGLLFLEICAEKEKLQAVIAGLSDGIIIADADFKILEASTAASALLSHKENVIGKSFFDLTRQFKYSMEPELLRTEILNGPCHFQIAERGDSGRTLTLRVLPFEGQLSKIRGEIIHLHDATELRRIEEKKNAFIGNIAHKLRTPLTVIEGNLPLLHGGIDEGSPEAGILEDIEKNSRALCDLVNSFVNFMELEIQSIRSFSTTEHISPKELAWQAIREVQTAASEKKILIADRIPQDLRKIWVAPRRLAKALTNILENAVKFSPQGGIVALEAEFSGELLRLRIYDEGPGIPLAEQEALFQAFHQVDAAGTGEVPGLGLGLAISREIIQEQGGSIQIASPYRFPDRGTCVTILLPAEAGSEESASREGEPSQELLKKV